MNSRPETDPENLRYHLALAQAPKVGPGIFKAILAYSGSAQTFFTLSKGRAGKIPRVGEKLLEIQKQSESLLRKADEQYLRKERIPNPYLDRSRFSRQIKSNG
jgi:DNA processing protein